MKDIKLSFKGRKNLLFLLLGVAILACLVYYMDVSILVNSFRLLGAKIFFVFGVAILWISCNAYCLSTLLGHKIPFYHVLYTQVTGDGYNVITPFAGLGGEPYKAKHLSNWVTLDTASEAIFRDRLIHSLSGIRYTSLTMLVVLLLVPLEKTYFITFTIIGLVLTAVSVLLTLLILSNAPNQFLGKILRKLKILKDYRSNPLDKGTFLKALFLKLMGRGLNLMEFLMIFTLLGISPSLLELVTISAMLSLSGTLLFIVPQGIGVNEAGISGAFKLVGRSANLGLSFGLIRRARVLFWAVFGVSLHLLFVLFRKRKKRKLQLESKKVGRSK